MFTLSLLGKWLWRLHVEDEALWVKVIKAIHGLDGGLDSSYTGRSKKSIWRNILKSWKECSSSRVDIESAITKYVGDGKHTSFWNCRWSVLKQPLRDVFPRLFALEQDKHCVIADRWLKVNGVWSTSWNWRAAPRGRSEEEMRYFLSIIQVLKLQPNCKDK